MKKLFIFFFLCFPVVSMAQEIVNIREVFKSMPDSLVPYLSQNNRLDLMDFVDAKMRAVVTNAFGSETEMIFLADDSIAVKMNESCLLNMKIAQVDTMVVIKFYQTYYTKESQYEVVSRTFNSNWLPLYDSVIKSSLLRRDDEVRNLLHF